MNPKSYVKQWAGKPEDFYDSVGHANESNWKYIDYEDVAQGFHYSCDKDSILLNNPYEIYMFAEMAKYFKLDFHLKEKPLRGIVSGDSKETMLKVWSIIVNQVVGLPDCRDSSAYKIDLDNMAHKICDAALDYYEYYLYHDINKHKERKVNE